MHQIIVISKDELQTLIIDSVNACLKFQPAKSEASDSLPDLLTREQAAQFLQRSLGTIDNLSKCGLLKKHYLGRKPMFKKEELLQALEGYCRNKNI